MSIKDLILIVIFPYFFFLTFPELEEEREEREEDTLEEPEDGLDRELELILLEALPRAEL